MIRRIFSLLLACVFFTMIPGCGKTGGPTDTIANFQNAFNHYDLNKMLDCVEPETAEALRGFLNVDGKDFTLSYSLIFSLMKLGFPVLSVLTNGALDNDDLPKLDLQCGNVTVNGSEASVPVNGTLSVGEGSMSFRVSVDLKQEGDNHTWFISGLSQAGQTDSKTDADGVDIYS